MYILHIIYFPYIPIVFYRQVLEEEDIELKARVFRFKNRAL